MRTLVRLIGVSSLLLLVFAAGTVFAQTREDNVVRTATSVLNEIMVVPAQQIPESMLRKAHGVAIVPGVVKVGLIGGVRHGRGVVVTKDDRGNWQTPQFVTLTGGSVGWQIGVQSTDVILVFKTRKSVDRLYQGKFTIGVDAAAAAGPVGRQAAAATDAQLRAEILSYSRSRGLFIGVSLDGSALQIDHTANTVFYYPNGVTAAFGPPAARGAVIPESAVTLVNRIAQLASPPQTVPAPVATTTAAATATPAPSAVPSAVTTPTSASTAQLQYQLADSAVRLNTLLDENWRKFLALPAEIFSGTSAPSAQALEATLANYDRVARNPEFRKLGDRPEFQTTHELLRKYAASLSQPSGGTLQLPPPPSASKPPVNTQQR
jgi:lipid-binding SYLF domain-containing protein